MVQVYDFVVPINHNFVANGILVHNSGHLEEDADVVVFLYRDSYYYTPEQWRAMHGMSEPYPEKLVELILAKHRQGDANRAIKLYYDKRHMRYFDISRATSSPNPRNVPLPEYTGEEA